MCENNIYAVLGLKMDTRGQNLLVHGIAAADGTPIGLLQFSNNGSPSYRIVSPLGPISGNYDSRSFTSSFNFFKSLTGGVDK